MGTYTPTTWNPGAAPGISAAELNRIETGVDGAHDEINVLDTRVDGNDGDIADHETRISALEGGGPNPHSHDNVTSTTDGFMDNVDKNKLDGIDTGAQVNQDIVAQTGLSGGGSGDTVYLQHADTSPLGGYYDYTAFAWVFSALEVDGFGHLTDYNVKQITYSSVGALPVSNPDMVGGLSQDGNLLVRHNGGFAYIQAPGGTCFTNDGVDECYVGGIPYSTGAFDVTCDENGAMRRLKYENKSSARRFKKGIRFADLDPDEVLKWRARDYIYKSDPNEAVRTWYVAEEILKASGERYVQRGDDGKVVNTDDRRMIATLVAQVQKQAEQIELLSHQIENMGGTAPANEGQG